MRVLWITNCPVGMAGELFYGKRLCGLWMDTELQELGGREGIDLAAATSGAVRGLVRKEDKGVTYYLLPGGPAYGYRAGRERNLKAVRAMLKEFAPDLIHVWGTEMELGLDVLRVRDPKIPALVQVQGVTRSLSRYFPAGMTTWEILKNMTPLDLLKGTGVWSQAQHYRSRAASEAEMALLAGNLAAESAWSRDLLSAEASSLRFYTCPITLHAAFQKAEWRLENVSRHLIMCPAADYPIKGLHMLLRALRLVARHCPDARLLVPGGNPAGQAGFSAFLHRSGYVQYIRRLIKRLELSDRVDFLPQLSPEEMAAQMAEAHVFVVPSAIENLSTTLKEAMLVGVPCVASFAGGIPEYAKDGRSALIYRFEDYEVLAAHILRIFMDDGLARRLSQCARRSMMLRHVRGSGPRRLMGIYRKLAGQTPFEADEGFTYTGDEPA